MTLATPAARRRGTFKPIATTDCWRLLETTTVGCVAFGTDDGIVILPLNFFVHEERIYFRTAHDSPIAVLGGGRDDVAFEVDYHDDLNQSGWSVLVQGSTATAETLDGDSALASTGRLGPWAPGERPLLLALTPRSISGRRVAMH
jgi:nitroimidazol reductase NimA-like FMN-containing flavoprotein (pyridoxamine 5'-phosphate oxidase superfamily)